VIGRIVIDDIRPRTPTGAYPAKAVVGERVTVSADLFRDGHDILAARVCWRPARKGNKNNKGWFEVPMRLVDNDRWEAFFEPTTLGRHEVTVEAWTDAYATWRHKIGVKMAAGQDVAVEIEEGARLIEAGVASADRADKATLTEAAEALRDESAELDRRVAAAFSPPIADLLYGPQTKVDITRATPMLLWVDRERALAAAWYEFFPRSQGGLAGAREHLPYVAEMGFDVVYFPPIHPIGRTFRKGVNNALNATADDPGSPWAIGGPEGGHTAIHPDLGTLTDFEAVVERAHSLGMEVCLDYALQCSPDHPWVKEHPEWFHHRPDGTIAYAENPPKKYQDIYPINFWPDDDAARQALWEACREILTFWIGHGVRIFRVDNPHTKPLAFWEWMIADILDEHPDVVFLAEAFTRPKMMAKLAEVGFTQSYTYFTWRTAAWELTEYMEELAHSAKADFMRPNFWPNTPDILSGPLRDGSVEAFKMRLVLAATLTPSYGIYSGYELGENDPMSDTNEEYYRSEKFELKQRDFGAPHSIAPFITRVNEIRHRHPALHRLRTIRFHDAGNPSLLAYSKTSDDDTDVVLVVVNLDPYHAQETTLGIDLGAIGMPWDGPYEAFDELTNQAFQWWGPNPYVRLDPAETPAHILHLRAVS
jgi:starch synthase (maltosyl-transferring)